MFVSLFKLYCSCLATCGIALFIYLFICLMKVWLLRALRMPVVFFRHRMDQGYHDIFKENPSSRFMLLSAVRYLLFLLWASPGAWIFWPGYRCYSASVDDGGRYCVLQHLTFSVGVVDISVMFLDPDLDIQMGLPKVHSLHVKGMLHIGTWWFKGHIVFDGTRQPKNFTEWQAEVSKLIW
jgi:hypothetical protein